MLKVLFLVTRIITKIFGVSRSWKWVISDFIPWLNIMYFFFFYSLNTQNKNFCDKLGNRNILQKETDDVFFNCSVQLKTDTYSAVEMLAYSAAHFYFNALFSSAASLARNVIGTFRFFILTVGNAALCICSYEWITAKWPPWGNWANKSSLPLDMNLMQKQQNPSEAR